MKKVVITLISMLVLGAAVPLVLIYSGVYSVSTYNHDNALINWALETGTTRSIVRHAKGIKAPGLDDPAMVQEGFEHYHEMCVFCHGAAGVSPADTAKGLWPDAPRLTMAASDWTPAELFWITKNGIKFSAMPAAGPTLDDGKVWALVAFLERLPQLSPADYYEMEQKLGGGTEAHGPKSGQADKAEAQAP
jgi:mono/diheme cytochrome c family protein